MVLVSTAGLTGWLGCRSRRSGRSVSLEIRPPALNDRPLAATNNLFQNLSYLLESQKPGLKPGPRPVWLLEIISQKQTGLQFIWHVPVVQQDNAVQLLKAYWPQARIRPVVISRPPAGYYRLWRLKVRPGQSEGFNQAADPINYLTAGLADYRIFDRASYRLQVSPGQTIRPIGHWLLELPGRLAGGCLALISQLWTGPGRPQWPPPGTRTRPDRPGLTVSGQIFVAGPQPVNQSRLGLLAGSLGLIGNFKMKQPRSAGPGRRLKKSIGRFLACQPQNSRYQFQAEAKQLARLYHWPANANRPAAGLNRSLAKPLPLTPGLMKTPRANDCFFGYNRYGSRSRPIYLAAADRLRHCYILGGTGTGKTTLLKQQIINDIQAGAGLAVIDPHGDLAEELLGHIPPDRLADVIYFDPDDINYPIAVNLLELDRQQPAGQLARQKDLVVEAMVSVLRKVFSTETEPGHRIEYILRNSLQTALALDQANLGTVFELLTDPRFRQTALRQIDQPQLKLFWQQEFGQAGSYQRVKMISGVTAKIGRYLLAQSTRAVFNQNQSRINFGRILNRSQILICNLARGKIGEDSARIFGATLLAKIQLALIERARLPESERVNFYLYVDEFQNFANPGFIEMLSESRKYRLGLILAQQSTRQQSEDRLNQIVLANIGSLVSFRTGSMADAQAVIPLLSPLVEATELVNLANFNFYVRLGTDPPSEPTSGYISRPAQRPDPVRAQQVRQLSRNQWSEPAPGRS